MEFTFYKNQIKSYTLDYKVHKIEDKSAIKILQNPFQFWDSLHLITTSIQLIHVFFQCQRTIHNHGKCTNHEISYNWKALILVFQQLKMFKFKNVKSKSPFFKVLIHNRNKKTIIFHSMKYSEEYTLGYSSHFK